MANYDKKYFQRQIEVWSLGWILNKFKFEKFTNKWDNIIDFWCWGGFLLKELDCKEKIWIEINDTAREFAKKENKINSFKNIEEVNNDWADIIISNHALEHVPCPMESIKQLSNKLKKWGKIVFVVPHQRPNEKFIENDINQHLYTWNALTLGNLFKNAGYKVKEVKYIRSKWLPYYSYIYKKLGLKIFLNLSVIYAYYKREYQVRIIAYKE